ncbi:hypothetical protein K504DRAFT_456254 [Pleomassaria siparia CBS 279.74]|uniref:Uncharacterized protein n=1 Tax=Pleomassaria siparia CBS 279.74 TaxID=1314801 RepID=A0A6G1K6Z9_9PLEO|nr:hypothetical protein K504DRAFT_456254 [Pleomassaria siparia CBS 279.74]
MRLQSLLALGFAVKASSLFVLLPLYIYPGPPDTPVWQPLYDAIAAYPTVQWQIIVNPNSGPGNNACPGTANVAADIYYQAAIAKLNGYANVVTLGYVDVAYGDIPVATIEANVDIYASWAACPGVDVSIDGIFFDDFVNQTSGAVTTAFANTISTYAIDKLPSAVTPIVFNPGSVIPAENQPAAFFTHASTVVDFENYASEYSTPGTMNTLLTTEGAGSLAKSAILIHDAPTTLDPTPWIHAMIANGVQAAYISQDPSWNAINGTLLNQIAAAITTG